MARNLDAGFSYVDCSQTIRAPILAIYAGSILLKDDPAARSAAEAMARLKNPFTAPPPQSCVSSAKVVRLPQASHFLFQSNADDVLREIDAFLGSLR